MWVTQAALPFLREQRSGHILQVSSVGGDSAFPGQGLYHASKWALEGFSDALSQEVAPFGIQVTLIEPGGFSTDWERVGSAHATQMQAYDSVRRLRPAQAGGIQVGEYAATSAAILALVDAQNPPLRLPLSTCRSVPSVSVLSVSVPSSPKYGLYGQRSHTPSVEINRFDQVLLASLS